MKTPLRTPGTARRRRGGWTAIPPLPVILAAVLAVPLLALLPALDGHISASVVPQLRAFAGSVEAFGSAVVDALTDPERFARGTGGRPFGPISGE